MKMASAQVLSNPAVSSRKKDLEAGRRKLEEFRKKKAATKKADQLANLVLMMLHQMRNKFQKMDKHRLSMLPVL